MFPPGIASAIQIINRRKNGEDADSKATYNAEISIKLNNENIIVDHENTEDKDFVKAAYVMLQICESEGLISSVNDVLKSCHTNMQIVED